MFSAVDEVHEFVADRVRRVSFNHCEDHAFRFLELLSLEVVGGNRVQEVHVACYHILWDLTHTLLADFRGKLAEEKLKEEEKA